MEAITETKSYRVCWQIPNKWGIPHIGIEGKWVKAKKKNNIWVPYNDLESVAKSIKKMTLSPSKNKNASIDTITKTIKKMTIKKSPKISKKTT